MTSEQDNDPLKVGDLFLGKYHVLGMIGRGGFGTVYRARSDFMAREVAIKIIDKKIGASKDQQRDAEQRGQQEAVILGKLKHPNIVEVYDAGRTQDGRLYIIMELLSGTPLSQRLQKKGSFEVEEGLRLLESLCGAFGHAHSQGVAHRDIKPPNIFLCDDGTVKVLDFGIAKLFGSAAVQTAPNMIMGSFLYLSPERLHALSSESRSAPPPELGDIYSLGLVAFEIFSGSHPLPLLKPKANLRQYQEIWKFHVETRVPLLDSVIQGFPKTVAQLVLTAIAKDTADRLPSMADFKMKAEMARLRCYADKGKASFREIERLSTPGQEPLRRDERLPPISTRPLQKRGTKKLFDQIPEATLEPAQPQSTPSLAPTHAASQPTRFDPLPTGPNPVAASPRGSVDTASPASRTITDRELKPGSLRRKRFPTTLATAAAGLSVGAATMLWFSSSDQKEEPSTGFVVEEKGPIPLQQGAPEPQLEKAAEASQKAPITKQPDSVQRTPVAHQVSATENIKKLSKSQNSKPKDDLEMIRPADTSETKIKKKKPTKPSPDLESRELWLD